MQEYMDNGARLGWLIDPKGKQVEIYRQGQEKEVRLAPTSLYGEQVLPLSRNCWLNLGYVRG